MAGRGPAPKDPAARRGHSTPAHEWRNAAGTGWQHGDVPRPPAKLLGPSKEAWTVWFASWFAWFWGPEDVPGLRQVVRLYDAVERGDLPRAPELRLAMDTYGITPKGQQDRRWRPPRDNVLAEAATAGAPTSERLRNLQVVDG